MVVLIKTMHQVRVFEQNIDYINIHKIDVGTGQPGQTIGWPQFFKSIK